MEQSITAFRNSGSDGRYFVKVCVCTDFNKYQKEHRYALVVYTHFIIVMKIKSLFGVFECIHSVKPQIRNRENHLYFCTIGFFFGQSSD